MKGSLAIATIGLLATTAQVAYAAPEAESEYRSSFEMPKAIAAEEESVPASSWALDFDVFVAHVIESAPEAFAYSSVETDYSAATLAFKEGVPVEFADKISSFPMLTVMENVGYSEADLLDYSGYILDSLSRNESEYSYGAIVDPIVDSNTFEVTIGQAAFEDANGESAESSLTSEELSELEEVVEAAAAAIPAPAAFDVSVRVEPSVIADAEAVGGGRNLGGGCTGAFPIKRNAGPELGILAAGHCPTTTSYHGLGGFFHGVYPYSISTTNASGTGGDLRWFHSKQILSGSTYLGGASGGGSRTFLNVAHPNVNSMACNYGRTTGHKCGRVAINNRSATIHIAAGGKDYTVGPLSCIDSIKTAPGDSGGPWYTQGSNNALGVHSGRYASTSCFSRLSNAMSVFNVSLWKG